MSRSERLYNQVKQFRKYVIERSAALDEEEADLQRTRDSWFSSYGFERGDTYN